MYSISIDYSADPGLKAWVENKLQPTVDKWYPILVNELPSRGYVAPRQVFIVFSNSYSGAAETTDNKIVCSCQWFRQNLDGEAAGAVVHELVHVVQRYWYYSNGQQDPGWLTEGIADYFRWFRYEPIPTGTRPEDPSRASYREGYRIAAGFLNYLVQTQDKQIVVELNDAIRFGRYSEAVWRKLTNRSVDELWGLYVQSLTAGR